MTRGLSVCSAHRLWLLRQPRFHIARSDHPIHDRLDEGLTWPAEARVRQVVAQESCPCVQTHQSIAHPGRCRVRGLLAAAVHMMRHCQAQILLVVVLRQPLRERTSATAAAPLQQARGMQQYETCAQALRMSKQSRADSILSMQCVCARCQTQRRQRAPATPAFGSPVAANCTKYRIIALPTGVAKAAGSDPCPARYNVCQPVETRAITPADDCGARAGL
jgi:hypothetical protein